MKKQLPLRRLLAMLLTVAMCLGMLPTGIARATDAGTTYTLVTDVNNLSVGDQIVIVAANANYALSTTQNTNNRAQAEVTKNDSTVTFGNDVHILTVKEGKKDGTFAFYTGSGYLYAASSSKNYLKTEPELSNNSSWTVGINNGVATIKAQGEYTRNQMRYNSGNGLFSCYSSGQQDICIYKLVAAGGSGETKPSAPQVKNPTASPASGSVVAAGDTITLSCATEGAAIYQISNDTDLVWLEDSTITIPADAKGELTYTVMARKDGYEDSSKLKLIYTVPQPMTIAEAKAATTGEAGIVVNGTVIRVDGTNIVVQDSTGGINLYFSTAPSDIAVGDTIEAMGKHDVYKGLEQLTGVTVYTKTGTAELPSARTVTIADLLADTAGIYESTRVYLENVVIGTINTSGNTALTFGEGESINVYKIPALTGIKAGDKVSLYAVVSDFNGYQLRVNSAEDVILVEAAPEVPAEAKTFEQTTELSTGEAVLVVKNGEIYYALGTSVSGKISAVEVTVTNGIISGTNFPVWDLSVGEGTAALYNGSEYLGYTSSSNFSASEQAYDWTVASTEKGFTFTNSNDRGIAYQASGNQFGAYATSNMTSGYIFDLMVFQTPVVPEKVDSINHLDKIYIYYPASQLAISDTASGSKLTGVAATVTDNKLTKADGMVELVVSKDANGYYSFVTAEGLYLTSGTTGSSLSFATEASDYSLWTLETAKDGFYIKNVNALYNETTPQYIEYYNGFTTYSFKSTNTSIYTFQFFKSGTASSVPVYTPEQGGDEEEGGETEPSTGVADGEYVIWAPAYNKALSSNYGSSYYNPGVAVTPVGNSVTGYTAAEIWTVTNNKDGTISISFGGQKLGMAASYSSLTLGAVNDAWVLEDAGNGLYYVKNIGRDCYIEWYDSKNYWSGYGTINSGSEGMFALRFTPAEKIFAVDDEITETIASWGGGYNAELTDKLYADGDKYVTGDHLDADAKLTVRANGAEVCPYYLPGANGYMGGENLGAKAGDYIQFALSTAGWADMELSFRLRATKAGPGEFYVRYSTDGGNTFHDFSTGSYTCSYTDYSSGSGVPVTLEGTITDGIARTSLGATYYISFDFDVPNGAANCDSLIIRLVPSNTVKANGSTGEVGGNIRIDSVVLAGSPIVDETITGYVTVIPDGVEEDQAPGTELTMSSATEGAVISYRFMGGQWQTYDAANKPVLPETLPTYLEVKAAAAGKADSVTRIFSYAAGTVESVVVKPNGGGLCIAEGDTTAVELSCATTGATIYYATSTDGVTFSEYAEYTEAITLQKGFGSFAVKAYAVKEGFNTSAEVTRVFTEMQSEKYSIYFGQLHSHTNISDGAGSITDAYEHAYNVDNLDFLAVTDHSNSFDGADSGVLAEDASTISTEWQDAKTAAKDITDETFVGIYGFEMTWSNGLGHINTFNTPGFQSRTQADYKTFATALQNYYAALKTVPGSLSQFNHPGTTFGDFSDFAHYDEELDALITLIEVGNGEGAIGSSGYFPSYEYYTRALDKGWHVAPSNNQDNHKGYWGDSNTGRSVVLAAELTEEGIYDAIRNYRVYATEDNDLSIYYTLDENIMGTILGAGDVDETVTIKAEISDPTDARIGKVEVIVNGGLCIASANVSAAEETVTLNVPADYNYYYLRVTQPDGDIAVTAPVWVGEIEAAGISALSAENAIIVAGEEQTLTLDLFNNESKALDISSITLTDKATGQVLATNNTIHKVARFDVASCTFTYTFPVDGIVTATAKVVASMDGMERTYTQDLELQVMPAEIVSNIIIDGTHGNDYVTGYYGGNMGNMTAIAAANGVRVTVETGTITAEMLEDCSLLVISAPARYNGSHNGFNFNASPFEDSFIELVAEYVKNGGNVVICGLADYQDTKAGSAENHGAYQLNRLLAALGSTMTINDDEAYDNVNYSNQQYRLYPTTFNTESAWMAGIADGQTYSQYSGCTVNAGEGTWLVKGFDTTYSIDSDKDGLGGVAEGEAIFLACEETAYGGMIFAAGGVFLSDFEVKAELDNIWDLPYANRTVYEAMLQNLCTTESVTDIADVRDAEIGRVFVVEGYVTSGTTNANTSFFDAIYVQDETGGITVFPYAQSGLAIGTKVRIMGYTDAYQGDKEIQIISLKILDEEAHVYAPRELSTADACDYETYGGHLIKTKGKVSNIVISNGALSQFDLTDASGKSATIFIDGYITNESGVNNIASWIKNGQTVSAVGLLYLHPEGDSDVSVPVLRVRNCDEIVKIADSTPSVPQTPVVPETPVIPEIPVFPEIPTAPSAPSTPSDNTIVKETTEGVAGTTVVDTATGRVTEAKAEIPADVAEEAVKNNTPVTLPIEAVSAPVVSALAPEITITTNSAVEIPVEIPVENPTPGTVVILVNADGTENILATSTVSETGVVADLPDGATVKVVDLAKDFNDVEDENWFSDAVDFVSARGILNGIGENMFGQSATTSRAMVWTMLARLSGVDTTGGNTWYSVAQEWAVENGVSDGTSPTGEITREQLVTMLWRFVGEPAATSGLDTFKDSVEISKWSETAAKWAVECSVMNGSNGELNPQGITTRAQLAQFVMNFINNAI